MAFTTAFKSLRTGIAACAMTALGGVAMADSISLGAPIPLTGYFAADGETMVVAGYSVIAAVSQPDEAPR